DGLVISPGLLSAGAMQSEILENGYCSARAVALRERRQYGHVRVSSSNLKGWAGLLHAADAAGSHHLYNSLAAAPTHRSTRTCGSRDDWNMEARWRTFEA